MQMTFYQAHALCNQFESSGTVNLSTHPAVPAWQSWVHCLAPETPQKWRMSTGSSIFVIATHVSIRAWTPTMKWPCVKSSRVGSWKNINQSHAHNLLINHFNKHLSPNKIYCYSVGIKNVKTKCLFSRYCGVLNLSWLLHSQHFDHSTLWPSSVFCCIR